MTATEAERGPTAGSADLAPEIEIAELVWTPAGAAAPTLDLRGRRIVVPPGGLLLVTGPSGSGKSTVLRAVAGLLGTLLPGELRGVLRVGGVDLVAAARDAREVPRAIAARRGYAPAGPSPSAALPRLLDDAALPLETRGADPATMRASIDDAAAAAGLDRSLVDRDVATLSGGERAQAAALVALVASPQLLLLDEPCAGLDAQASAHVAATIAAHPSTRVVALHDVARLGSDAALVLELPARDALVGADADHAAAPSPVRHGREELVRLDDACADQRPGVPVSVSLDRTTITIVEGPTGSGKSTLLGLLAGTLPRRGGSRRAAHDLVVRMAPQDPGLLLGTRPALEHVRIADRPRLRALASSLGVAAQLEAAPGRLSDGERRRVALAVAMAPRPDVAILDEPTDGLDDRAAVAVRRAILAAAAGDAEHPGCAVAIATHDPRLAIPGARHVRLALARNHRIAPTASPDSRQAAGRLLAPQHLDDAANALVRRANPLTRAVVAALWLVTALIAPATPLPQAGIAVAATTAATAVGVPLRATARLGGLLLPAAAGIAAANLVGGASVSAAVGAGARLAALAAGSLVAIRPVEPLRLADAAIERLGAPFAPTMAFLATLATIPALQAEAGERRAIRRLARRGPDLRVLIDLFDAAVRAVPRLAIALESRGVRLPSRAAPASRLRPSTFGRADAIVFGSSLAALALAVAWNAVGAPLPAILAR